MKLLISLFLLALIPLAHALDQEALLQAIRENPAEDTPRLVYADWLDEHGTTDADRARAEFIRLQVRLDRIRVQVILKETTESAEIRQQLVEREDELLKKYQSQWLPAGASQILGDKEWERGFLTRFTLTPDVLHKAEFADVLAHGEVKMASLVELRDQRDRLDRLQLAKYPHVLKLLQGIPTVVLTSSYQPDELRAVLRVLPRPRHLHVNLGSGGAERIRAIADSPLARDLVSLTLHTDSPDGLEVLARSGKFPKLESLRIRMNQQSAPPYSEFDLDAFSNSNLPALKTLALQLAVRNLVGIRAFVQSPLFRGLHSLEVPHWNGDDTLRAVSKTPHQLFQMKLYNPEGATPYDFPELDAQLKKNRAENPLAAEPICLHVAGQMTSEIR